MPRGKRLTNWDRAQIAVAYDQHPREKAENIREAASRLCGRELGLSTVERELAKLRKRDPKGSYNPLDDQWSLASLGTYPVDTNYVPLLLEIQSDFYDNMPDQFKEFVRKTERDKPFLTNRLAIWISRLYPLARTDPRFQNMQSPSPGKWPDCVDDLVGIAMWYSMYERGCELAHVELVNTVRFDAPTLEEMKLKIALYSRAIMKKKGIVDDDDPDLAEELHSMNVKDYAPKGGRRK